MGLQRLAETGKEGGEGRDGVLSPRRVLGRVLTGKTELFTKPSEPCRTGVKTGGKTWGRSGKKGKVKQQALKGSAGRQLGERRKEEEENGA